MKKHRLDLGVRFNRRLDELHAAGRMTLLRAQSLEDALLELQHDPMRHDGQRNDLPEPHWLKICRASGGVDTGLRVVYLLGEDGSVRLDDILLLKPGEFTP